MTVVPHPPYSPDLAPSDFFLFSKLKIKIKGRRFQTEEIQAESQAVLNTLNKRTSKNASKTGSAAEIVVKPQKGTTLKVISVPNVQGKPFCVLNHQSGNLFTSPRIY